MAYEAVIGLEIHAQLLTATKIFCGCSDALRRAAEHARLSGLPRSAGRAAGAQSRAPWISAFGPRSRSGARSNETSIFARKNYFYPDLPKGYQISQYDQPLATGGRVARRRRRGGPARRHHARAYGGGRRQVAARGLRRLRPKTYVDYNRSGAPLIEIVTEPDLARPPSGRVLRAAARHPGLARRERRQHGRGQPALRRQRVGAAGGRSALGTKAEVKNLNSFRFVAAGARVRDRAADRRCSTGGRVVQETRLWDASRGPDGLDAQQGRSARLPLFPRAGSAAGRVMDARLAEIRDALPELPDARRERLVIGLRPAGLRRGGADPVPRRRRLLRADGEGRRGRRSRVQLADGRAGPQEQRRGRPA